MIKKSGSSRSAKALALVIGAAAIVAALDTGPALAQRLDGGMPSEIGAGRSPMMAPGQWHAVNPSLSLSAPTTSPLQEQMQDDYATSLMNAQRQLSLQNPSGYSPAQLSIGRQLDGYMGPR